MKGFKEQYIVVTGGSGFIGSGVIRFLNEKGNRNVIVVDDLGKSEKWKNLVGKNFADVVSKHQIFDWLKGREAHIEAIIHLGACSSTVETDATYLLENNYRFSVKLAEYALKYGLRFIYASSAATYGDGSQGFSDNEEELDKLFPLNMYGYSKHLFDLWLKQNGLLRKVVGLKYFNVFGPNEFHKGRMASAITHFLPKIQKEGKIELFESSEPEKFSHGEQKRDFIYVKDVARMTCSFLDNDAGGIFNIGSGQASSWNQLARSVFKALNIPEQIIYKPMPPDLIGKYQNYTCADMRKTEKVLGEAVKIVSLEDSVKEYVNQYLIPQRTW